MNLNINISAASR